MNVASIMSMANWSAGVVIIVMTLMTIQIFKRCVILVVLMVHVVAPKIAVCATQTRNIPQIFVVGVTIQNQMKSVCRDVHQKMTLAAKA